MAGPFEPDLTLWGAWSPAEVARRLAGVQAPWYVAAGWSIDLFLGGQRRAHEDVEIAVPRARFDELARAFGEYEFFVTVGDGDRGVVWRLAPALELVHPGHRWIAQLV